MLQVAVGKTIKEMNCHTEEGLFRSVEYMYGAPAVSKSSGHTHIVTEMSMQLGEFFLLIQVCGC